MTQRYHVMESYQGDDRFVSSYHDRGDAIRVARECYEMELINSWLGKYYVLDSHTNDIIYRSENDPALAELQMKAFTVVMKP
jgi:hypothetical protein